MATYENDVLIQRKQGADTHIDYPVTRYANILDAPVVYNSFADVNPAYTSATLFATVFNAMANSSVLRTQVTANAVDYPASGLLEVIKQDATHAACTLSAADGVYTMPITPENAGQILAAGILSKWSKSAASAELSTLESEMADVKKSVSDGKQTVAAAITAKGVSTAATAPFDTMASNIRAIKVGIDTSDATATAARILSGYTAYAKGSKITGTYTPPTCPSLYSMTSDATATASRILSGYTAYVAGSKLTGTYTPPSCPTLVSMTSDATATASVIRSGYTAYVKGNKITGTYTPPSTSGYLSALARCINNLTWSSSTASHVTEITVPREGTANYSFSAGAYACAVQGSSGSLAYKYLDVKGAAYKSTCWATDYCNKGLYFIVTEYTTVTFLNTYDVSRTLDIYLLPL